MDNGQLDLAMKMLKQTQKEMQFQPQYFDGSFCAEIYF